MSQFWLYFKLGLTHVLDLQAYDHILFLIVLTLPYTIRDWKKVLWLVSIFTLGHTLSLVLSVYKVVNVNGAIVEFLIPITILITAIYNVLTAGKKLKRETVNLTFISALFFGLIHGLGFSTYFKQIIAGEESKWLPLLDFALGIELAQVVIVVFVIIATFVAQNVLRVHRKDWIMVLSAIVIGVVLPMLQETFPF